MARLSVRLLGAFQATLDGQPLSGFSAAKVRALLAYLALESSRSHGRESLAVLLWPDEPQEVAQANLRQALANLRQVIGDRTATNPIFDVTRDTIHLAPQADLWVDVRAFESLVEACRVHRHRRVEACDQCVSRLTVAAELYTGDFLADLFVSGTSEYEEWALLKREWLRESHFYVLSALTENALLRGAWDQARSTAALQLQFDPWREEAHRQLMLAHAAAGSRSAALAQYETCRRVLAAEFQAEPSVETRALADRIRAGRPVGGRGSHLLNWPASATSFVGRTRELAALITRLQDPTTRLVTVTGLGGVGKSRLVAEAGSKVAYSFADGACYAQLARVAGSAAAGDAMAAALGILPGNPADPLAEVILLLKGSELLLVLDNCQPALGHVEVVRALLRGCPRLTILATGSQSLGLEGEWVIGLDGLSGSGRAADRAPEENEAAQLFAERMRQAGYAGDLSEVDRAAIDEICELVGGLPLAIELAAAWSSVLSCAEIAAEVSRSISFLDADESGDRDHTLAAVVERAWLLLPPREQHVFQQVAVFRGGFRRTEAQDIIQVEGAAGAEPGRALDAALRLLVNRSLLRRMPSGRYRQHPLVKGFAEERLAQRPSDESAAQVRHAAVYLGMVADSAQALKGADQPAALALLSSEMDNIELAWRRSLARDDFDTVARALSGLSTVYDLQSRSHHAVKILEEAADALERTNRESALPPQLAGHLHAEIGMHTYRLHELTSAKGLFDRSLALLPVDADAERALALHGLGNTVFWQGDAATAETHYREALRLAECARDSWRVGCITYLIGDCASVRGDHSAAMTYYEQSLTLFRELGDHRMIAVALSNLGDGYRRQGLLAESRAMYAESLELAERIGHRRLLANNHNGLGEIAYDERDLENAVEHFSVSQAICREIGSHSLANLNLVGLTHVACVRGDPRSAKATMREALRSICDHAGWAVLPVAMAGFAHILSLGDNQDKLRAVALLAQVLCHETTWEDYRHRAMRLLMQLQAELPEDQVAEAIGNFEPAALVVREVLAFDLPEDAPEMTQTKCLDWGG